MPLTRRSSASTRKADDESQNDSGYGSQDSLQIAKFSQVATPNTVDTSSERGTELRLSSTTTLLSFNSGIDEVFTKRFYAIQPSVESLLLQYTQRKSFLRNPGRHKPMVIRLMLLGAAKNVAEPHIVVFCAREMRKRVQHFFDTDELIKTFYKPADAFLPSFEVAVCGCAPQLRNGETYIEVFCDTTAEADITDGLEYKTSFTGTLCGTPIRMQTGERVANATLGGLVKIEFMNGETKLYGLTASHPIRALLDSKDKSVENDENASLSTTSTSSGSDWSEGGSEEAPDDFCSSHLAPQKNTDDGGHSDAWQFEYPIKIGDVLSPYSKTAVDVPATHGSLDWALIEINAPQPNRLPVFLFRHDNNLDKWKLGIAEYLQESPSATQSLSEERVLLMCGSSGAKTGNLAPQPARILISPQYSFVDAYLVVLDDGDVLVDGDSGSWVVKQDTHEVVGQIVATDILGAAYIIPLCDIFDDICKSLGAAAVSLPVPSDIAAIKTLASQVSASNDDFEMLLKDEKSDSPLNEPGAKHYVTHNDYNPLISRQNSNGVETLSHDKNQILGNHVVMSKIRNLVEYYFSVENLSKDMHLRRHMDSQGYVPLLFVAAFKRMRELCPDPAILSAVCDESFDIDYVVGDDDCERLRRHDGWEIWILPWDQRDELARNNGAMCVTFKSNRDRQASPGRGFSKIKQYLEKDSFETSAQQQILVAVADTLRISPDDILPSYSFPALGGDEKAAQKLEDRLQKQGIGINADDAMRCRTIAELQTCARPLRSSASYSTSDLQSADSAASSNYSQQTEDHMSDKPLKGIFKQSKPSFPEPQDSTREVVAPAKDDKKLKEAPARARWTKISRAVVNPEALTMGKERYEVQDDFVVVLSVLSKGEIQAYAALTQALRERRRARRKDDNIDGEDRDEHGTRRTTRPRAVESGSSLQELAQLSAPKPAETSTQQPANVDEWYQWLRREDMEMVHKRRRQRRAANSRGKVQTRSFEPLEIDSEPQEQALLSTNNSTAIRKSSDSSPVSIDIGLEKKGDVKYDAAHQAHQTYLEATSLLTPPFQGFSASSNSSSGQENFELLRQIESARNNQYGDLFIPVRAGKSYGRSSKNSDSGYSSYSNNSSAGSVNSSRNSSRRSGSPGSQDSPWYTTYKNLPASLPRVTEPPWGERTIDRRSNEAMEYIEEDFSPYFNLSSAKPAVRPRRRPLSNYTRNPPRLRDIRSLNMGAEKEGLLRHWEDRPGADVAKERQAPPPSPLQSYLNSWAAEEILERRFEKRPLVTHGTPPTLTWMQTPSEPPPPPIRSTPTDNAAVETPRRALRRVKRLTEEIVQPPPPPSGQAYSYQSPATATDVDEEDLTRRLARALNTPIGQPEPRYVPQKIEEDGEGG